MAIAGAVSAQAAIVTGPVTNSANGHAYYLLAAATWTQSEAESVTLGGHLVTINDDAENDWVYDTFSQFGGVSRALWLGLNDQVEEGTFVWSSGQTSSYTKWSQGQPDNGGGGLVEHFTHMWFPGFNPGYVTDRYWNDLPDHVTVHGYPVCGVVEVGEEPPPDKQHPEHPQHPLHPRHGLLSVRCSQMELCWPSTTNYTYQLQYKYAATTNRWLNLGIPIAGNGGNICVTDAIAADQPQRLYRLYTLP